MSFSRPTEFCEHPFVRGAHLQTLAPLFWPGDAGLPAEDSRFVDLSDGDRLLLHTNHPFDHLRQTLDGVLMVHGLGGSAASPYMARIARKLNDAGILAIRMDMRGCGAARKWTKGVFHADRAEDLRETLVWLHKHHPHRRFVVVGFSLGANLILKLLNSAEPLPENIAGCVAVAPPIDLDHCCRSLGRGAGRFYDRYFARTLWRDFQQRRLFIGNSERVTTTHPPLTLLEFDTRVTAPLGGFSSVEHYYETASAGLQLTSVDVPTAVLFSQDDPIVPVSLFHACKTSLDVQFFPVGGGGHLGFLAAKRMGNGLSSTDRHWMDWCVVDWARQALATDGLRTRGNHAEVCVERLRR